MKVRFKPPCSGERIVETFKEAVSASDTRWEIKEFFPPEGQEWRMDEEQLVLFQRSKGLLITPLERGRKLLTSRRVWKKVSYSLTIGPFYLDETYDMVFIQIENVLYLDGAHYSESIELADCGESEEGFKNLIIAAVKQLQGD